MLAPAQGALPGGVDLAEDAVEPGHGQHVHGHVEDPLAVFLGLLAVADVAEHGHDAQGVAALALQHGHRVLGGEGGAVLAPDLELEDRGLVAVEGVLHAALELLVVLLVQVEKLHGLVHDLVGRIPGQDLPGRVDVDDPPVRAEDEHGVVQAGEDAGQPGGGLGEGLFGLALFCDVAPRAQGADDVPVLLAEHVVGPGDDAAFAVAGDDVAVHRGAEGVDVPGHDAGEDFRDPFPLVFGDDGLDPVLAQEFLFLEPEQPAARRIEQGDGPGPVQGHNDRVHQIEGGIVPALLAGENIFCKRTHVLKRPLS